MNESLNDYKYNINGKILTNFSYAIVLLTGKCAYKQATKTKTKTN